MNRTSNACIVTAPSEEEKRLVHGFAQQQESHASQNDCLMLAVAATARDKEGHAAEAGHWKNKAFYEFDEDHEVSTVPEIAALQIESKQLCQAWEIFESELAKDKKKPRVFGSRPQTFEDIVNEVEAAKEKWSKKKRLRFGNSASTWQSYFHRFCNTLEAHQNLLKMVPTDNRYTAIFCGAVTSLIKASVNHERVVEGLSRSLAEISEEVSICSREDRIIQSGEMRHAIAKFYTHIFLFFADAMRWYSQKSLYKILDSFREDFWDTFKDKIMAIKTMSSAIHREAQLGNIAQTADIRECVEDIGIDMRVGLTSLKREQAEIKCAIERLGRRLEEEKKASAVLSNPYDRRQLLADLYKEIGLRGESFLLFQASACLNERHADPIEMRTTDKLLHEKYCLPIVISPSTLNQLVAIKDNEETEPPGRSQKYSRGPATLKKSYTRPEIQLNSRDLENYIHSGARLADAVDSSPQTMFVDEPVIWALQDWSAAEGSVLRWISGPEQEEHPSSMSLVAAHIAASVMQMNIPCVSFFCDTPRERPLPPNTRETVALVELGYSLIRQLVEHLPFQVDSVVDFSPERFTHLDGTMKSWPDAMALLQGLLDLTPPLLFCIIDGFRWLDDPSTEAAIGELLRVLQDHITTAAPSRADTGGSGSEERVFKVLLTTAGESTSLTEYLPDEETVYVINSRGAHNPGGAGPGRRLLPRINSL